MGAKRNSYVILVRNSEVKRPVGRPKRTWMVNIKIDHRNIVPGVMDWSNLAQDMDQWRVLVNRVMNLRVP
jgi:hypothetical protein